MVYNTKKEWERAHVECGMAYPSEYVIRIFKGTYPNLDLDKRSFQGKKICDVGCGDGRNIVLLNECGFNACGVEITSGIVKKVKSNLDRLGVDAPVEVGSNDNIPYETGSFDYLLSWNACYYMGEQADFKTYIKEFARVIKPDGYLVMSIPKKTCFIYQKSQTLRSGYQKIVDDPFGVRNGAVLRMFQGQDEIKKEFDGSFKDFVFGDIQDDCFGFSYHWHLVICRRK